MDLVLRINEQIIARGSESASILQESPSNRGDEGQQSMVEEIVEGDRTSKNADKQKIESWNEEDKAFIAKNDAIVQSMKEARSNSGRAELIRNTVYKEVTAVFDYYLSDSENLSEINNEIFTQLGAFSYDVQAYRDWLSTRKLEPLIPKADPTPEELAELEARKQKELEERLRQEEEAKKAKKGAKKDSKKKDEEEKQEDPPSGQVTSRTQKKEDEKEKEFDLTYYNKQLSTLDEEKITPGICLDAIVDQITRGSSGLPGDSFVSSTTELENFFSDLVEELEDSNQKIVFYCPIFLSQTKCLCYNSENYRIKKQPMNSRKKPLLSYLLMKGMR